jgi:hypothetical protein
MLPLVLLLPLRARLSEFVVLSLRLRTELDVDSRWLTSTLLSLAAHPAASKVSPKKLAAQIPFANFFIGTSFSQVEEHFWCHLPQGPAQTPHFQNHRAFTALSQKWD